MDNVNSLYTTETKLNEVSEFLTKTKLLYLVINKLFQDLSNINNRIRRIENIPTHYVWNKTFIFEPNIYGTISIFRAFTRDAVFYVPIIDEVNKAFDSQFIDQILTNDEAISDVELEEKVFEYFDQVFMQYVPHLFN